MQETDIKQSFRDQAIPCRDLGSPFTARICELFADRLTPGSAVADEILNWPGNPAGAGDALALRLCGSLHALVIAGKSQDLTAVYPPHDTKVGDDNLWRVIDQTLKDHAEFIIERLKSAPQTNEVRRASILLPGFWAIAEKTDLPFVMSELGASAGLNLHWDRFYYQLGKQVWGDTGSNVRLEAEWSGDEVVPVPLTVRSRAGCDLNPLDLADGEARDRLLSYIWPDQTDRFVRTRAAIEMAAAAGVKVDRADAIDWLEGRLAKRHDNAVHVIYHTITWHYFPQDTKERGRKMIEDAGLRADENAPLAWLRFEMDDKKPGAALTLTEWPGGEERYLARADFHGRWIDWQSAPAE